MLEGRAWEAVFVPLDTGEKVEPRVIGRELDGRRDGRLGATRIPIGAKQLSLGERESRAGIPRVVGHALAEILDGDLPRGLGAPTSASGQKDEGEEAVIGAVHGSTRSC